MKSWKIGAVSGLIAGIVLGIVIIVIQLPLIFRLGLPFYYVPPHYPAPDKSFSYLATIEIAFSIIWGIVLGIIYSKIYDLIPGRNIWKDFIYGLGIYLITGVRGATYYAFYGDILKAISCISGIFIWIAFSLTLGFLYRYLVTKYYPHRKELKIMKHDIGSGINLGAIAGLAGGMVMYGIGYAGVLLGLWPPTIQGADIWLTLFQFGAHLLFNMIWGIIFGILFVMFYGKIPNEGILKGIIFGLVIYFITSFRTAISYLAYGYNPGYCLTWGVSAFIQAFIVGLVLGLLYRKPTK